MSLARGPARGLALGSRIRASVELRGRDSGGGANGTSFLYGTAYADTIHALADEDALVGYWGNDRIYGNDGVELIYGGPGDDVITVAGGRFTDYVYCGRGFDTVIKRPGSQVAYTNVSAKDCERTIL